MRRVGVFLLAVIALIAMVGPVSAQPKVTITGFVDNISSLTNNISTVDQNYARKDSEWSARTRVRPDITAEVGTTKFVLGLEIDSTWGQTGGQDTNVCLSAACPNAPQRFGTTSGWDLNTDVQGTIEVKWAYTEFDMPIIPVPTRFRLGAQPWQSTYKLAVLTNGDFAGANVTTQWSPMVRSHFTYAAAEEANTGPKDGFVRGDDIILVTSVEITPLKGLDIRPIFSWASITGTTSGAMRQARGGVATGATTTFETCPGTAGPGTGACSPATQSQNEERYTVGVDARWRFGAFSLDPTILYQFGSREQIRALRPDTLTRDAWFIDVRGGWQAGPLLVELGVAYTTGNKAEDRIDVHPDLVNSSAATRGRRTDKLKFYEPISTDTSYWGGWAAIQALDVDYFSAGREPNGSLFTGTSIGSDKYGLMRVGARASYALTPAFTLRTAVTASWTAEEVDTSSTFAGATGLTPGDANGDARYLGTELDLGFQWRFAPNVAFDLLYAYNFAGGALGAHLITSSTGVAQSGRNPQDAQSLAARLRYSW
jgi:hypothetical protein